MDSKDIISDVKIFLAETLAREKLTVGAQMARMKLLNKINSSRAGSPSSSYIDMTKNLPQKNIEVGEMYEQVMPDLVDSSSSVVASVSASAIRYSATHCGILSRRAKLLFIEHLRRYWGAVSQRTLYLYSSERESKPYEQIDLSGYQARPVLYTSKKDFTFELVCPGSKTYQFVVGSSKEMEGWMEVVNRLESEEEEESSSEPNLSTLRSRDVECRELPSLPTTYDIPQKTPRRVLEYENMASQGEDKMYPPLYHFIPEHNKTINSKQPVREVLYKNIPSDDSMYYNLMPAQEEIYQTISEEKQSCVQRIIHKELQLYEAVDQSEEESRPSR